jgi:hypothetical protein
MTPPNPPNPIRVFVVDDHVMFAEALLLALGCDERIEPLGFAGMRSKASRSRNNWTPTSC